MRGISWRMRLLAYNVRKLITAAPVIKRLTLALCAISVVSWLLTLCHACHARQSTHSVKPVQICLLALLAMTGSIYKMRPLSPAYNVIHLA